MSRPRPLHVHVLGVEVTLRFTHPDAAAQAERMFSLLKTHPWRSPDVTIECDWANLTRDFVRTRRDEPGTALPGVRVISRDTPQGGDWLSLDPPFPPVDLHPFKDRFVRLHGGAVTDATGRALLILGDSGFGKSTLCRRLVLDHGVRLLTDEDVFLHRRSRIVEPFPVGYAPWKPGQPEAADTPFAQELIAETAGHVAAVLLLRPLGAAGRDIRRSDANAAMRGLLESPRPGGTAHTEIVATLTALARSVPIYELAGGTYPDLLSAAPSVADLLQPHVTLNA